MNSARCFGANRARLRALLVALLALAKGFSSVTATADTEDSGPLETMFDSEFILALSGFFLKIKSTLSVAPSAGGGSGQEISIEGDLGLDDSSSSAWIGSSWRSWDSRWIWVNTAVRWSKSMPPPDTS